MFGLFTTTALSMPFSSPISNRFRLPHCHYSFGNVKPPGNVKPSTLEHIQKRSVRTLPTGQSPSRVLHPSTYIPLRKSGLSFWIYRPTLTRSRVSRSWVVCPNYAQSLGRPRVWRHDAAACGVSVSVSTGAIEPQNAASIVADLQSLPASVARACARPGKLSS